MNLRTKMILLLNKSFYYRKLAYQYQKWSVKRNPMKEINRNYELRFNKKPNLTEPRNLIEKIYWMQLHCDTSIWTLCADKYRMRKYVSSCGCDEYLPKLYGVWNSPDEIDWQLLPKQFVIKANNGCASVLVVKDKGLYSERNVKKQMKHWLDIPYGYRGFQPHYLPIKPCIIAEELLPNTGTQKEFSPNSLVDYKIWCFKGTPESILVVYDRTNKRYFLDLYDTEWERMPEKLNLNGHFEFRKDVVIPKPECLDEMLKVASKLSEPFPEVRVDFYVVNDKPIIGELTFSAGYGNLTEEYYQYLGDKCDISDSKEIKKKIY